MTGPRSGDGLAVSVSRRDFLKRTALIGGAAVAPPFLAACGSGGKVVSGGSPARSTGGATGTIVGGLGYNITELDPHIGSDVSTFVNSWHVFESLIDIDPVTRRIMPVLASGEPEQISDKVWRIKIRDGATFHDGSPVKASDVVFSLNRIKDPKTASLYAQYVDFIATAKAVDGQTVEFRLKYPSTLLRDRLVLVKVVPEAIVSKNPKALSRRPVGTGPFSFADLQTNDHMTFKRFEGYNGPKVARVRSVKIRVIEEVGSRLAALRAGEVHAIEDPAYRDIASLGSTGDLAAKSIPSFNQTIIIFNCSKPPFDDKRARQAVMYGIDRDALAKDVFLDNAEVATSYIPQGYPGYAKPSRSYAYDPATAKELLAAAGHATGLSFELMVNSISWIGAQAPFVKQQLQGAGMTAQIRQGQSSALFDRVAKGDFQAFLTSTDTSILGADPDLWLRWIFYGDFPKQYTYWETPQTKQVEGMLDAAVRSTDESERNRLWAKVQDVTWEEACCPTLHHRHQPTGWSKKLQHYEPLSTAGLYFAGSSL
jgi:peptide/nickel transport system substrate-binding protein